MRVGKPAIDGVKVVAETGDCSVLSVRLGEIKITVAQPMVVIILHILQKII